MREQIQKKRHQLCFNVHPDFYAIMMRLKGRLNVNRLMQAGFLWLVQRPHLQDDAVRELDDFEAFRPAHRTPAEIEEWVAKLFMTTAAGKLAAGMKARNRHVIRNDPR